MSDNADAPARSDALLEVRIPDDVLRFARAMSDAHGEGFDWRYFLEKPWKWSREYEAWLDHYAPNEGDPGFTTFVEAIQ